MRRALTLLAVLAACLAGAPAAIAVAPRASLPDLEDEVMCVACGTSLAVSQSPVADQERAFIERRIARGETKAQIKAALVDTYGQDVIAQPPGRGFDAAAWIVPIVLAVAGILGVAYAARRWRRREQRDGAEAPAAAPELSAADTQRLDAELAAHDR